MSGTMDGSDTFLWVGGSGSVAVPTNWRDLTDPTVTSGPPGPMNTLIFNSGDPSGGGIGGYAIEVTGTVEAESVSATTADITGDLTVTTGGFPGGFIVTTAVIGGDLTSPVFQVATADISGSVTTDDADIGGSVSGTVEATGSIAGGNNIFLSSLDVTGEISMNGYLSIAAGQVGRESLRA